MINVAYIPPLHNKTWNMINLLKCTTKKIYKFYFLFSISIMVEINSNLIATIVVALLVIYLIMYHHKCDNKNEKFGSLANLIEASMSKKPVNNTDEQNACGYIEPPYDTQQKPMFVEQSYDTFQGSVLVEPLYGTLQDPMFVEPATALSTNGLYLEGNYNYSVDRDRENVAQISNDRHNFRELVITGNAFRDKKTRQVGIYDKLNVYGELCVGTEREQVCVNMNDLKKIGRVVKNEAVGAGAF